MKSPFEDVTCACLPRACLPMLAGLRVRADLRVALDGDLAWVRWEPDDEEVLRRLLPVAGITLFERRQQRWHRWGHALPSFDFPTQLNYKPLAQVLFPQPTQAMAAPDEPLRRLGVRLVRSTVAQPATALCAEVDTLLRWAELMPSASFQRLRAGRCETRILVLGTPVPAIVEADRFWGQTLLVPLGWRPEPDLPERVLREALAVEPDEIVLWQVNRLETIPADQLQPLTRVSLRLAQREAVS